MQRGHLVRTVYRWHPQSVRPSSCLLVFLYPKTVKVPRNFQIRNYHVHSLTSRLHLRHHQLGLTQQQLAPHLHQCCLLYSYSFRRNLHTNSRLQEKDSSKVESTVKALKEESQKTQQVREVTTDATAAASATSVTSPSPAVSTTTPAEPKRSLLKRIWDELVHYYHGFRLLFIDIKVSSRLIYRVLNGDELTRREHKQLVRTVSDLFRLLPFSVFIIVPFMELLLPVAVKLFPNMLPSTFQTSSERDAKTKKQLKVKLEMAKFLQDTLDEMAPGAKGEHHSHTAKEFAQFCVKIRESGEQASNEEIIKFSKLFEDEITLDSLSRPQLTALCRLLELQPIGTNNFLRFQLRMKLRNLRADDQMIRKEGIETLTTSELQAACRARGMRAFGMPENRLRYQLSQWLELSLSENIPPSLLLLSRALFLPEHLPATDQLKATISTLPQAAVTEAKYKIGEREGKVDNRTKIELIRLEEEAIKQEKEEILKEEKQKKQEAAQKPDTATLMQAVEQIREDFREDIAPILKDTAPELEAVVKKIIEVKQEELSKEDFKDLEDAMEILSQENKKLLIEKEELSELKEEMAEYKEDVEELKDVVVKTGKTDLKETKAATRLYNRVNKMITKMDRLIDNLHKEKKTIQAEINEKTKEGVSTEDVRDDIIGINELVLSIRRIQKSTDDARLQMIVDLLDSLDIDHDGKVEIDHVLKVIDMIGRENVKVSPSQMKDIIELLLKEEFLEMKGKADKQKETEKTEADASGVEQTDSQKGPQS